MAATSGRAFNQGSGRSASLSSLGNSAAKLGPVACSPRTAEQARKGTLLAWLKRLDHGLRKGGLHQLWIGSPKMPNRIPINSVANRSISISLEEELLAQLDAQGSNRSALVSQALSEWLARRRIDALTTAYAHLASLQDGDLAAAGDAAVAMGEQALAAAADG
jgi:hypothetical protein